MLSSLTSFLASTALTCTYLFLRHRLAQAAVLHSCDEELLLRITTCLAQNGYHTEVGAMVQINKAFRDDEQIWDAYKDYAPGVTGRTRLMYASAFGLLDRLEWLLARGARVDIPTSTPSLPHFSITRTGYTALMLASSAGHLSVVRALIARGASVNASAVTIYSKPECTVPLGPSPPSTPFPLGPSTPSPPFPLALSSLHSFPPDPSPPS